MIPMKLLCTFAVAGFAVATPLRAEAVVSTCAATFAQAAAAPVRAEELLMERARAAAALIAAEPTWPDTLFSAEFLAAAPPAQLVAIGKSVFAQGGAVVQVDLAQSKGPFAGVFDVSLEKDLVIPMSIAISEQAPNSIVSLWFKPPAPALKDLAEVAKKLAALPGTVSFAVHALGGEKPVVLAELNPEAPLAIGSAFKLYVLGALAEDVAGGKRKLADVVTLEARWRSLPSGELHKWPLGAPVTLSTLANLMISNSDNTATDHLLFTLGRERVEQMLVPMGNEHAAKSIPFLATNELFRLKHTRGGHGAIEYLKLEEPVKQRAFLAKDVATWPLDEEHVESGLLSRPQLVNELEWFASAGDLCRAMDWLRKNTESGAAASVRDVLAIHDGVEVRSSTFPWVGFKGGSEPGVLNLTLLLKSAAGKWYAVSAGWNDPENNVEDAKLVGLVRRAVSLLGKQIGAEKKSAGAGAPK